MTGPDFGAQLAELSQALQSDDLETALKHLAAGAARLVPGTLAASITLWRDSEPYTFATSSEHVLPVDEAQYADRAGPCVAAARGEGIKDVQDVRGTADDWPRFAAAAQQAGVLSSLSLPLRVGTQVIGSLNLYGASVGAFTASAKERAEVVAAHGGVATVNAQVLFDARTLAAQMQEAMASRATIDRAVGILMATQRTNELEAFQRLVTASQNSNSKLRDVARRLVDSYDTP